MQNHRHPQLPLETKGSAVARSNYRVLEHSTEIPCGSLTGRLTATPSPYRSYTPIHAPGGDELATAVHL